MNSSPAIIRVLSDSRPGHENQSVGLADAIARRTGAGVDVVRWRAGESLFRRIAVAREGRPADLVIGAGHGTHLPLLAAASKFGAKSIVIMRPSLPTWLFDLCLVPRHDMRDPMDRGRIIATRGALNRIAEVSPEKTNTGLIMIGGPSRHHEWDGDPLPGMMAEIVRASPHLAWTIGDSRRTPQGLLPRLGGIGAEVVPHTKTVPGWLAGVMGLAREVWVTEDSVSMIFEALTAGARVGILPLPVKNPRARTVAAVRDLVASGHVRTFAQWKADPKGWPQPTVFHETARCAEQIIKRFFS